MNVLPKMYPSRLQHRLLVQFLTCVVVFGILFILASKVNEKFAMLALVLLGAITVLYCVSERKENQKVGKILEAVFVEFRLPAPEFRVGSCFSFPFFQFNFQSESDYQTAQNSGALKKLKEELQSEYADSGRPKNPFDIERAVDFDFPGRFVSNTT